MDAKTADSGAEVARALARTQTSSVDPGSHSGDLTIEGFATLVGDIAGQLDKFNSIALAMPAEAEREYGIIMREITTLAGQLRQLANAIFAATAASGNMSREAAIALAGIKEAVARINEHMAHAIAVGYDE